MRGDRRNPRLLQGPGFTARARTHAMPYAQKTLPWQPPNSLLLLHHVGPAAALQPCHVWWLQD